MRYATEREGTAEQRDGEFCVESFLTFVPRDDESKRSAGLFISSWCLKYIICPQPESFEKKILNRISKLDRETSWTMQSISKRLS